MNPYSRAQNIDWEKVAKIGVGIAAGVGAMLGLTEGHDWWKKREKGKLRYITILGYKSAGKTTLWNGLQGIFKIPDATTANSEIKSFKLKNDEGHEVYIQKSQDIGGGKNPTNSNYDNLIGKDTFVIYLISLPDFFSNDEAHRSKIRTAINGQLSKIATICKKTGNTNTHIIVGTCHNQYNHSSEEIKRELDDALEITKGNKDYKILFGDFPHNQMLVAEFRNPDEVNKIKKRIFKFKNTNSSN